MTQKIEIARAGQTMNGHVWTEEKLAELAQENASASPRLVLGLAPGEPTMNAGHFERIWFDPARRALRGAVALSERVDRFLSEISDTLEGLASTCRLGLSMDGTRIRRVGLFCEGSAGAAAVAKVFLANPDPADDQNEDVEGTGEGDGDQAERDIRKRNPSVKFAASAVYDRVLAFWNEHPELQTFTEAYELLAEKGALG